jgi:predicted nucleotidyltransferase
MEREEMTALVASWAASEPLVKKAYIFGSRVRGDHRNESDLDVAVELQPRPGDSGPVATWISETERLRSSLANRIPVTVDLQWYGGAEDTPTIHAGLLAGSIVVYHLAAQPCAPEGRAASGAPLS